MKKHLFAILFALAAFCFAENKPGLSPSQCEQFDAYLGEIVEAYHIPGMAFFVTTPEETIFERNYGQCTSLDQQFFIGSMSKSYTALCVMQLAEKGLVNLDEDISTYLPDYKFPKKVSVLSLLNHTSGFDTHAKLFNAKITDSYGKYEYANVNYDLLGKIIETVSGKSYEDYIQQNVFCPLSMADSNAKAQALKESPKFLNGNRNYFGFFKQGKPSYPTAKSWFHEPAGYIASTPHDHAKYLRMYLNGGLSEQGERIIKKETIDSMWYTNVPYDKDSAVFYGKGWNYTKMNGLKLVFHGGQVETGITYMFILPEKQLAVCFMLNGNDEFVTNSLMDNAIWNSLAIIKGEPTKEISHSAYIVRHAVYDALYLLVFAFSLFILIKAIKTKDETKPAGAAKVKAVIFNAAAYILWPLLLLSFTKLFVDTPLWVVRQFVPDLYFVILISAAMALTGGIIKAGRAITLRKSYF